MRVTPTLVASAALLLSQVSRAQAHQLALLVRFETTFAIGGLAPGWRPPKLVG
jgi:hypothetical protein